MEGRISVLGVENYMVDLHNRARNGLNFWESIKSHYRTDFYKEPHGEYVCDSLGTDCELSEIEVFNRIEMFKNYLCDNNNLELFMEEDTDCVLVNTVLYLRN